MGLFGRPTPEEEQRAQAWGEWLQRRHPLAIASLVLGVFSLIEFGVLLIFGIAGIILGAIALRRIARARSAPQTADKTEGRRLAWAGIVLSALSLVLAAVVYSLPPGQ